MIRPANPDDSYFGGITPPPHTPLQVSPPPTARTTSQINSVGFRLSNPSVDSEETQREKEHQDVKVRRAPEICLFLYLVSYFYIINAYVYY
jgi:hypothetical protein